MHPPRDRLRVAHGIAWNTLYEAFQTLVGFGSMLLLVRILAPADYGLATAVVGWLALFNALSCEVFMSQALQQPADVEPEWDQHWAAGLRIQFGLCVAVNSIALGFWFVPAYRPLAPLLHISGTALLLDVPNKLGSLRLRRELNFRRLRIANAAGTLGAIIVTLVCAIAGFGARAIIIGNICNALPYTVDLLFIKRWRPVAGWWTPPDWRRYRPALKFGAQQGSSVLLQSLKTALAAAVLPVTLGFAAIGLLSRAQALYAITVGRLVKIAIDTIYPLLPRYAANLDEYAERATLFVQALFWIAIPGAAFLGLEGKSLTRLVYGTKWLAMEPLIWPAVATAFGVAILATSNVVLLAVSRLRACFLLDVTTAACTVPPILIAWLRRDLLAYSWGLALGQAASTALGLMLIRPLLSRGWWRSVLVPPCVATVIASLGVYGIESFSSSMPSALRLVLAAAAFGVLILFVVRILFAKLMRQILIQLPASVRLQRWLRFPLAPTGAPQ